MHYKAYKMLSVDRTCPYMNITASSGVCAAGCEPEGALYVFPKLTIPENAKAKALAKNVQPDFLYCLELLEATGIVSVPGSGFGQVRACSECCAWCMYMMTRLVAQVVDFGQFQTRLDVARPVWRKNRHPLSLQVEGTFHVRLTILPSEEDIDAMLDLLTRFHASFMAKYSPTAAAQERKLG